METTRTPTSPRDDSAMQIEASGPSKRTAGNPKTAKHANRITKRASNPALSHSSSAAQHIQKTNIDKHKRVWKACERCRMKKTKCDGEFPCKRCKDDGLVCTAGTRKKTEYKQLPKGYAEVLENTQFALIATVHKLYAMVRSGQPWELGEPELNERGRPIIHNIASKLGCIRPQNDLDLPVDHIFPEDVAGLNELAATLETHQREREREAAVAAATAATTATAAFNPSSRAPSTTMSPLTTMTATTHEQKSCFSIDGTYGSGIKADKDSSQTSNMHYDSPTSEQHFHQKIFAHQEPHWGVTSHSTPYPHGLPSPHSSATDIGVSSSPEYDAMTLSKPTTTAPTATNASTRAPLQQLDQPPLGYSQTLSPQSISYEFEDSNTNNLFSPIHHVSLLSPPITTTTVAWPPNTTATTTTTDNLNREHHIFPHRLNTNQNSHAAARTLEASFHNQHHQPIDEDAPTPIEEQDFLITPTTPTPASTSISTPNAPGTLLFAGLPHGMQQPGQQAFPCSAPPRGPDDSLMEEFIRVNKQHQRAFNEGVSDGGMDLVGGTGPLFGTPGVPAVADDVMMGMSDPTMFGGYGDVDTLCL